MIAPLLLAAVSACGVNDGSTVPSTIKDAVPDEATTPPMSAASVVSASSTTGAIVPTTTSYLWISSSVMPPSGGPVAFAVVVPAGAPRPSVSGGVTGHLERLAGSTWELVGLFGAMLDFWGGFGAVVGPGEELRVALIGIGPPERGAGPLEFVRLPELTPGRYRLRSGEVTGEFVVQADAPPPPPLQGQERGGLALLTVSPALLPRRGGSLILTASVGSSTDELTAFTRELNPNVDIELWTATGWQPHGIFPVVPAPITNATSDAITLPPLAEGMYRVVRHHPSGGLTREFWITNDPAIDSNATAYSIPGWTVVSTSNGTAFGRPDGSTLTVTVTDLATVDPAWQPGASMQIENRPTVRGRPAAIVARRDGRPEPTRLIVLTDTTQRVVLRGSPNLTVDDLIAAVETLQPFPMTGTATIPDVPGRLTGSVTELTGHEGAATVTGWLVITPDGTQQLCDTVERAPTLRCTGPTLEVDTTFIHWEPPPTTAIGPGRITTQPVALSGSLKSDILYIGVL